MDHVVLTVTTTGSDGAAVGSTESELLISGKIMAVVLDYHASAPNTTDVNLYMTDTPSYLILDYDNKNADIGLHPRKQACIADGTAVTIDGTYFDAEPYIVHGKLTLAVAGCNALTGAVTAWIFYEE